MQNIVKTTLDEKKSKIPLAIKLSLGFWMAVVMFVFTILFGPPEFWLLMQRVGIYEQLHQLQVWLQQFFTAGYMS